jgi:3-isopropylmalate/(R)-2-methylmalate dehydratase small subunit
MKILRGRVWKLGDNVDTDVIFPSQYMLLATIDEMKVHTFEPILPGFHREVSPGDVIVALENFGCGSSREQAPAVLKAIGVGCVVARSFARIFFRNAINIGLPVVVCDCHPYVSNGDTLAVDLSAGRIRIPASGVELPIAPFPEHVTRVIEAGGLLEYLGSRTRENARKGPKCQ